MDTSIARPGLVEPKRKVWIGVVLCVTGCVAGGWLVGQIMPESHVAQAPPVAHALAGTVATGRLNWGQLSNVQRATLLPLKKLWPDLDQPSHQRWLEVAEHMRHLSPQATGRAQVRMAEWATLSPQKRAEARLRYVNARQLTASKRNERWSKYQLDPKASLSRGVPDTRLSIVAPATVLASPGATTLLLNQLHDAGVVEQTAEESSSSHG